MANDKEKGNGKVQVEELDGFVDFQSDSFSNVAGYWNLPKDGSDAAFKGERLQGILLQEVKTIGGQAAQYPFYAVELTRPHKRITVTDDKKNRVEKEMPAGTRVGVSTWVALNGLGRKLGHEVAITYLGQRKLEKGKSAKEFNVKCSAKPVRDVEPQHDDVVQKGDKEEAIPF